MQLYHYRSIESALKEIENGTFHYASRDELNDPVEGYVRVYWQGDVPAWEGLFRNYICSLYQAIELYLLDADEKMLHHKTIVIDIHAFDDLPNGEAFEFLGGEFLEKSEVQKIIAFYGRSYEGKHLKVCKEELELMLYFLHSIAFTLCIQYDKDHSLISSEVADSILQAWTEKNKDVDDSLRSLKSLAVGDKGGKEFLDDEKRTLIIKVAKDLLEDGIEHSYIRFGFEDDSFLYGNKNVEKTRKEIESETAEKKASDRSLQHRKWMTVSVDFPKIYVDELCDMIYPETYVVCLSGKNNDSAMWGNYADHHRGVCLVYEFRENDEMKAEYYRLKAKPVSYSGERIERNFFTTLGRLNYSQVRTWLTGTKSVSSLIDEFENEEEWRDRYWDAYEAKTYRKLKAWEYENEYRLVISNMFDTYQTPESRNLRFNYKSLKGVVFGINTSEFDKMIIVKKLLEHKAELADFTFYQAEYDERAQDIIIREKKLWKFQK